MKQCLQPRQCTVQCKCSQQHRWVSTRVRVDWPVRFYRSKPLCTSIPKSQAAVKQLGVAVKQSGVEEKQPGAEEKQPGAEEKQQGAEEKQQGAEEKQQGAEEKQQGAEEKLHPGTRSPHSRSWQL